MFKFVRELNDYKIPKYILDIRGDLIDTSTGQKHKLIIDIDKTCPDIAAVRLGKAVFIIGYDEDGLCVWIHNGPTDEGINLKKIPIILALGAQPEDKIKATICAIDQTISIYIYETRGGGYMHILNISDTSPIMSVKILKNTYVNYMCVNLGSMPIYYSCSGSWIGSEKISSDIPDVGPDDKLSPFIFDDLLLVLHCVAIYPREPFNQLKCFDNLGKLHMERKAISGGRIKYKNVFNGAPAANKLGPNLLLYNNMESTYMISISPGYIYEFGYISEHNNPSRSHCIEEDISDVLYHSKLLVLLNNGKIINLYEKDKNK